MPPLWFVLNYPLVMLWRGRFNIRCSPRMAPALSPASTCPRSVFCCCLVNRCRAASICFNAQKFGRVFSFMVSRSMFINVLV